MTLPGISDSERLEELRWRVRYAREDCLQLAEKLVEAQDAHEAAERRRRKAENDYVSHLEMMAAGVASK